MNKWLLFSMVLLATTLFAANSFATITTDTPLPIYTYMGGAESPDLNYIMFQIHVSDDNTGKDLNAHVYIDTVKGGQTHELLTTTTGDFNLDNYANDPSLSCVDGDFSDSTACTFTINLGMASFNLADGNYFIDVNVYKACDAPACAYDDTNVDTASSFYLDRTEPALVTGFYVNDLKNGSVQLVWDQNTDHPLQDFYKYRVYHSTSEVSDCSSATNDANITSYLTNSYTLSGLDTGVQYYFCLTKMDYAGNEDTANAKLVGLVSKKTVNGVPPMTSTTAGAGVVQSQAMVGSFVGSIQSALASVQQGNLNAPVPVGNASVPAGVFLGGLGVGAYVILRYVLGWL